MENGAKKFEWIYACDLDCDRMFYCMEYVASTQIPVANELSLSLLNER